MTTTRRDLASLQTRLTDWLRGKLPDRKGLAVSPLKKPSAGVSNETLLLEISWNQDAEPRPEPRTESLVARLMPAGAPVFPEYDLARQFRILQCLQDTDVPVPRALWYEADEGVLGCPFYVMRRIDGQIPSEIPPYHAFGFTIEIAPERRARMWWAGIETLARIHTIEWQRHGLSFLEVDNQLDYYERFLNWARGDRPQPILDATLAWLKSNRVRPQRIALCWGDSRLPNMIFRNEEVVGVLDWEMAFLGDPENDLAWWLFLDWSHSTGYGIPRLEGLPSREETVQRYEERTGYKVEHLFYHEVLAAFRYGVITMRVARNMAAAGLPIAAEDMETNNTSTQRLAALLDLPPPGGPARPVTHVEQVTARVQFHLTGPGGSDWYVVADKGKGSRHEGRVSNPDVVFTMSAADWEAMQRGDLNRTEAFLGGKMRIDGDITLMLQLEELISKLR